MAFTSSWSILTFAVFYNFSKFIISNSPATHTATYLFEIDTVANKYPGGEQRNIYFCSILILTI